MLQVEKRGRFITNIGFANFVTAAVDSDDPRIKGSCMVILEESDRRHFRSRHPPRKSWSTSSRPPAIPIFNLRVPASRIVGGYTVKDGVIVPNFNHSEVIEAVFRRTRVTVGLMTAAKLLSAVEPVIRYQRGRFRGAEAATPGTIRYELGHPAARRRAASPGRCMGDGRSSRIAGLRGGALLRRTRPARKGEECNSARERGIQGGRAEMQALRESRSSARIELLCSCPATIRARAELADRSAGAVCTQRFAWPSALSGGQAVEHRPRRQHDARSREPDGRIRHHRRLPRLPRPQVDGRATRSNLRRSRGRAAAPAHHHHDEPRSSSRSSAAGSPRCAASPRHIPAPAPAPWPPPCRCGCGRSNHLQNATDADGDKLYHGQRQGVTFPLADALCWLLASRYQILDVLELEARGPEDPVCRRRTRGHGAVPERPLPCAVRAGRRRSRRASAPNWCSATTGIPRGMTEGQQGLLAAQTNSNALEEHRCPASPRSRSM